LTFFNRKEEVIDIELTQFGKHKLSKGMFKPAYYAFFDDDVIYDYKFAGITTETQNQITDRIKETPRLRTQYAYSGIESEITKNIADIRRENTVGDRLEFLMIQPTAEKHFNSASPIGNSQLGTQKSPTWQLNFLKGTISGSVSIQTNAEQPSLRIPQVDVEVKYVTNVLRVDQVPEENEAWNDSATDTTLNIEFEDGTDIHVKEDYVVLQVEELNSLNLNKEFDIEVFKVEKEVVNGETTDREMLIPLKFQPDFQKNYRITDNNVYVPTRTRRQEIYAPERDNVEYFLDIDIDSQIDSQLMCELKPADRTKGLYSKRFYECEDVVQEVDNIYEPESPYEDPCED